MYVIWFLVIPRLPRIWFRRELQRSRLLEMYIKTFEPMSQQKISTLSLNSTNMEALPNPTIHQHRNPNQSKDQRPKDITFFYTSGLIVEPG
jgi:hypothetical protein